jgi:hypothetical protein
MARRAVIAIVLFAASLDASVRAEPSGSEATPSLLQSPAPFVAALRSRFGRDTAALTLSLYAETAEIQVQDPAIPAHVNRFSFEEGAFLTPEPVPVGRSERALRARLFRLADVDLSIIPGLLEDARARADTEDSRVTHVVIERPSVHGTDYDTWGRPAIRVYVDGPRGGAFAEYGLDGKRKRVTRW